jgi:parallel beta-helix repeat protein
MCIAVILLLPATILAGTTVYGNVSGTWDLAGSPYWVVDNCQVTGTLTIDPGVEVLFAGYSEINVTGTLNAVGTESNPIVFSSMQSSPAPGDWSRIYLDYCNLTMDWWEVSYASTGIYVMAHSCTWAPIIQNTTISDCSTMGIKARAEWGGWTYLRGEMRDCSISACDVGIHLEDDGGAHWETHVRDNEVTGCTTGIFMTSGDTTIIENNTIAQCTNGITNDGSFAVGGVFKKNTITNCTNGMLFNSSVGQLSIYENAISNCDRGIYFNSAGNVTDVNNNSISHCTDYGIFCSGTIDGLFWDNILYSNAIGFHRSQSLPNTVTYNCLFNDSLNFVGFPGSYGVNWITNANGDSCDLLLNIMLDPLFVDSLDFHLTGTSPCIDAGDPSMELDPDYTIGDIGVYYFHQDVPIIVAGEDSLNFGSVEPSLSDTLEFYVFNISGDTLDVSGVELIPVNEFSTWIEGSSSATTDDSILVKVSFSPTTIGLQQSTLFIYSDAVNEDSLALSVVGEGGAVPAAVENLEITLDGSDAILTWSPVTESMSGDSLTPDAYLIFYTDTTAFGYEHYQYLSLTYGDTTFTHEGVVQFANAMYYIVYAYVGDLVLLNELVADPFRRWTMEELLREVP